ncbi:MAG: DNA-directed RNA polymerase subunit beta, partial [Firmicutes bacterium]|nr:DNA-directed RNA polymerase subunit beta [Bacillota bacterium]
MLHPVRGHAKQRYSFAKLVDVLDLPNLIEIQRSSYQWFLEKGLKETFDEISPILDFTGNLILEFVTYSLGEPKYSVEECKERDVTYAAPLKAKVRLHNKETGEVKEQEVFMGDFPLMTDKGTFIINGAERVVVSQLVRSPGVYFSYSEEAGKELYEATIMPNRGAWLEFELDATDVISVRVDRTRKIPVTAFLRAIGYGTDGRILELFNDSG